MSEPLNQFDRLPPHDIAAEMCAIASCVLDANVREEVLGIVTPEDFFQADNAIIFGVVRDLHRASRKIDAVTIRAALERGGHYEEVGGIAYIAEMLNSVPAAVHGADYARRVAETARLRDLIALSNDVLRATYAPHRDQGWEQMANEAMARLSALVVKGVGDTVRHISQLMGDAVDRLDKKEVDYIATGFNDIDATIGGLKLGRMTVIAGRPGMGKSQVGKQILLNVAGRKVPCGLVSIEEDEQKIANNLLANVGNVPNSFACHRRHGPKDSPVAHLVGQLVDAAGRLGALPLYVDDRAASLANVESSITRMATKYGCKVIVVDYLQLIDVNDAREDKREGQVRLLSNTLKRTFKRLNVAGVVLAQLNRAAGKERPALHNLRESGSIEQDGDLIALLYREDYYREQEQDFKPEMADHLLEVNFAKHKDGPTGLKKLYFDGKYQRVVDWNDGNGPIQDPF